VYCSHIDRLLIDHVPEPSMAEPPQ
jgi:hypothetical protein